MAETRKTWTPEDTKKMDDAALAAAKELFEMPPEQTRSVAQWWMRHYTKAGHKRLGRVMLEHAKELPKEGETNVA